MSSEEWINYIDHCLSVRCTAFWIETSSGVSLENSKDLAYYLIHNAPVICITNLEVTVFPTCAPKPLILLRNTSCFRCIIKWSQESPNHHRIPAPNIAYYVKRMQRASCGWGYCRLHSVWRNRTPSVWWNKLVQVPGRRHHLPLTLGQPKTSRLSRAHPTEPVWCRV